MFDDTVDTVCGPPHTAGRTVVPEDLFAPISPAIAMTRQGPGVSKVSEFYGIKIKMYHRETHHLGRPHFHARHGGDEATIDIKTFEILAGGIPVTARRLISEWASAHQTELLENWTLARAEKPLRAIEPLA